MCWWLITLGGSMTLVGAVLVVRFFVGRGRALPEVARLDRVEAMIVGAILSSLGPLLLVLGTTGAICRALGIA